MGSRCLQRLRHLVEVTPIVVDLRARDGVDGGRGDQARRLRFHREAARARARAGHGAQRRRLAPAAHRKPVVQARRREALPDRRRFAAPRRACARRSRKAAPTSATVLDLGRERRRQGAGGAGHSPREPAARRPVRAGQLRGDSRRADRVGAVRAREGFVHRRDRSPDRQVRAGRQGHDLPRRDRRHEPEDAGQGAARAAGAGARAAGQQPHHQGRRPRDRRHEQEPRGGDHSRHVPRGPVLPPQRHPDSRAAAARAQGRYGGAGAPLRRPVLAREQLPPQDVHRGGDGSAASSITGAATSASCATSSSASSS